MQKLVWQNSNGDVIDLTSGNYGITEWEGFANTSLNIQSQQVPFQDGGVFLDALMEQRELSVTLAMNDNGNLEERYRMRRELIHSLNPKLGEGYLIYTNDFISKRIKCVAQIPLFETHNSNDSGTPKASLAWTACEPYWEDLEETEIIFSTDKLPYVENEGDIPAQVKIDLYANNAVNPCIQNLKTNQKIMYNGTLNKNLNIVTERGNKKVVLQDLEFKCTENSRANINSICYSEKLGIYLAVSSDGSMMTSYDGINWKSMDNTIFTELNDVVYSEGLSIFVAVGVNGLIITSINGIEWTRITSNVNVALTGITYSEDLQLFVAVGINGTIITSTDGVNWNTQNSGTQESLFAITYSSSLNLFVAVGNIGCISSDGTTWTLVGSIYKKRDITYSEDLQLFVTVGMDGEIGYSSNGTSWNWVRNVTERHLMSVTYSEYARLFVIAGYGGDIFTSSNGINWVTQNSGTTANLLKVIFSDTLNQIIITGEEGKAIASQDGVNWELSNNGLNGSINNVIYSKKLDLFIAVGTNGTIITSTDGKNWDQQNSGETVELTDVAYSENLGLFVVVGRRRIIDGGYYGTLITSSDGITWTRINITGDNLFGIYYSEDRGIFIIVGGNQTIMTSTDGINWAMYYWSDTYLLDVTYSKKLNMFVAIGRNIVRYSSDGTTWGSQIITGTYNSITYSEINEIFIAVGEGGSVIKSKDGINWEEQVISNNNLKSVIFIDFFNSYYIVDVLGNIYSSIDGINWILQDTITILALNGITYSEKQNLVVIVGNIILNSVFLTIENQIQKLSVDSDMTFMIDIGKNQLRLTKSSGYLSAKVSYRQKYIGV